jgi:phosphohistidine phosphatase
MNLIFWRHADAEDGRDDLARRLTSKGRKQAEHIAEWLDERLPKHAQLLVSPAVRAQETAARLERSAKTCEAIAPGARAAAYLKAAGWPEGEGTLVLVGHQPGIGSAVALALTGKAGSWHMKKGAIWWIASAQGESLPQVVAVLSPDLL